MLLTTSIIAAAVVIASSFGHKTEVTDVCERNGFPDLPATLAIAEILSGADDRAVADSLAMECHFQDSFQSGLLPIEIIVPKEPVGVLAISGRIDSDLRSSTITCDMDENNIYNRPQKTRHAEPIDVTYQCNRGNFNIILLGLHNEPVARFSHSPFPRLAESPRFSTSRGVVCVHDSVLPADLTSREDLGKSCTLKSNKTTGRLMFNEHEELLCSKCCARRVWDKKEKGCVPCPTRLEPNVLTTCSFSATSRDKYSSSFTMVSTPANAEAVVTITGRTPATTKDPCQFLSPKVPQNLKVEASAYYVNVSCDPLPADKCWAEYEYQFQLKKRSTTTVAKPVARFLLFNSGVSYRVRVRTKTSSGYSKWSSFQHFRPLPDETSEKCHPLLWRTGNGNIITVRIPRECKWSPFYDKSATAIKVRYTGSEILQLQGSDTLTFELVEKGTFNLEVCLHYDDVGDSPWIAVDEITSMQSSLSAGIVGNFFLLLLSLLTSLK